MKGSGTKRSKPIARAVSLGYASPPSGSMRMSITCSQIEPAHWALHGMYLCPVEFGLPCLDTLLKGPNVRGCPHGLRLDHLVIQELHNKCMISTPTLVTLERVYSP
jgi:hypothetical protein